MPGYGFVKGKKFKGEIENVIQNYFPDRYTYENSYSLYIDMNRMYLPTKHLQLKRMTN